MSTAANKIISLLELGDIFYWVTAAERNQALALLEGDSEFERTIAQLDAKGLLATFFSRYYYQQAPSLFDAIMLMASRAGIGSTAKIANSLVRMSLIDRNARIIINRFGFRAKDIFGLANDLARSLRTYGLLPNPAPHISTRAIIPSDTSASFSGSGATGRDIFAHRVPSMDQAQIAWEQLTNPRPDPGTSGSVSHRYSNPLDNLVLPNATERLRQAVRVTSLPISTLFHPLYPNRPPSRAAVINAAAKKYRLTPQVIGAIILAEQRDQSHNEDKLDYTAATHSLYRRTTSIGLGQVRDDTAQRTDLFSALLDKGRRQALDRRQIATLLACDEFNIFAVAKYIRYVADLVGSKTAKDLPNTAQNFPGIDFAAYAGHAQTWPTANIAALGSEYTSRPWDDRVTGWGPFVGEAFSDMSNAGISW